MKYKLKENENKLIIIFRDLCSHDITLDATFNDIEWDCTNPYFRKIVEENERLYELNERINKAIEFILPYRSGSDDWYEFLIEDKCKLLDILRGDENE